jgi:hypothetical protein
MQNCRTSSLALGALQGLISCAHSRLVITRLCAIASACLRLTFYVSSSACSASEVCSEGKVTRIPVLHSMQLSTICLLPQGRIRYVVRIGYIQYILQEHSIRKGILTHFMT